jgi:hypothetical protein
MATVSSWQLANTPEFAHAQRQRKKIERLFAKLKNQVGLRRLRCGDHPTDNTCSARHHLAELRGEDSTGL